MLLWRFLWVCVCLGLSNGCGNTTDLASVNSSSAERSVLQAHDVTLEVSLQGQVSGTLTVTGLTYYEPPPQFQLLQPSTLGKVNLIDINAGVFLYEATQSVAGMDYFVFQVRQGSRVSNPAIVHILVTDGGVGGVLTFDFVPTTCTSTGICGLQYSQTVAKPIRHAVVRLTDANDVSLVLGETVADARGYYMFPKVNNTQVQVVVVSQWLAPKVAVRDNTQKGALYMLVSGPVDISVGKMVNMHAPSGWHNNHYDAPRSAGPFAVLDVINHPISAFDAVRPGIVWDPLTIYWSVHNKPEYGNKQAGLIATSHWDGHALYLLGAADIDTDEYDSHVVAHEWAHYFEATQSRSDSPGGSHTFGDVLDMRVAFSEGWANALSAMVLYPDVVYKDCSGTGQASGFSFAIDHSQQIDTLPGWFSEWSVQGLLYDLFDMPLPEKAPSHVGLGPIYDTMVGPHRDTMAFTSIFSFVAGFKMLHPSMAMAADTKTLQRQISPIVDAYGTTETHTAGYSYHLPVYMPVIIDGPVAEVILHMPESMDTASYFNKLGANRYLHFVGDGLPVNIVAVAPVQIDMLLLGPQGEQQATRPCMHAGVCQQVLHGVSTVLGVDYVINIQSSAHLAQEQVCSVAIGH